METNLLAEKLRPYAAVSEGTLLIWPGIGVLAALFFSAFHFDSVALKGAAIVFYVCCVLCAVAWQAKKAGVQPSFRAMPRALRRNMYGFWAAITAAIGLVVSVALAANFLVGGLLAGVSITAAGVIYHLRFRSIVQRLLTA